jgi:hypothetical protein
MRHSSIPKRNFKSTMYRIAVTCARNAEEFNIEVNNVHSETPKDQTRRIRRGSLYDDRIYRSLEWNDNFVRFEIYRCVRR